MWRIVLSSPMQTVHETQLLNPEPVARISRLSPTVKSLNGHPMHLNAIFLPGSLFAQWHEPQRSHLWPDKHLLKTTNFKPNTNWNTKSVTPCWLFFKFVSNQHEKAPRSIRVGFFAKKQQSGFRESNNPIAFQAAWIPIFADFSLDRLIIFDTWLIPIQHLPVNSCIASVKRDLA